MTCPRRLISCYLGQNLSVGQRLAIQTRRSESFPSTSLVAPGAIFIIVTDRDFTVTQLPTTTQCSLTEFLILTFSIERRFIFLEIFKQQTNKMMRMLSLSLFF